MADGRRDIVPVGSGFGKSGAKGGGINETPNTLRSRQIAKVIDLLGEGTIEGLVDGMKSIVFDTVRVQNDDGTFNAQGVAVDWRLGSPNQTVLPGFPGVQREVAVGVQIKKNISHVISIDNSDVDRVRITMRVNALTRTTKDGTINGSAVTFIVYIQSNGGGYQRVDGNTIRGKTTGPYQRALTFALPKGGNPWDVKVERETEDAKDLTENNDLFWDSYTELTDVKIRYRNSAVVGFTIDAEQFSAIPTRLYDTYGLLIQVPTNYDPDNGTYSGVWNGTFKTAWSNNPAWVFYNLIVNHRYGLGDFIAPEQIDKWGLYSIGQWCDERVPDGKGGQERRWVCNAIISDRAEAFDLMQQMASVFRGQHYWAGGLLTPVADMPSDVVGTYTNANVSDGIFTYQGSDRRARHTQAAVAWADPSNLGQRRIALVEDQDGIQRYGLNRTDLVAIGCTSEGQAHRIGKWTLYTELNETSTVSFKVGLEGVWARPGDLIQVSDITITAERRGGRTLAGTQSSVTLDGPVTFHEMTPAYLAVAPADGKVEVVPVIIPVLETPVSTLTMAPPYFSADVGPDAVWVLMTGDLTTTLWRVINVEEDDGTLYSITGVAHDPGKWAFVERNIILAERDISNRPTFEISNLTVTENLVQLSVISVGAIVTLAWQSLAPFYDVDWRPASGNWTRLRVGEMSVDIPVTTLGQYDFKVTPVDMAGFAGKAASISATISGLSAPPADVVRFRIQILGQVATFQWAPSPDLDVQIGGWFEMRYTPATDGSVTWTSTIPVVMAIPGTATTVELPNRPGTYLIKAKDSSGILSQNAATVVSFQPDTDVRNFFRIEEHPFWQGSMVGTEIHNPGVDDWLVLGTTGGAWDDQADLIDDWATIDILPIVSTPSLNFGLDQVGTYNFFYRIDLGGVFTTILTVEMLAFPFFATSAFVDDRIGDVDSWQDWDLMDSDASGQVMIRVRQTDDDPSGTPTWSAYQPFISSQYTGRAFEFQAVLVAPQGQQVAVESLAVTADLSAKSDSKNDVNWSGVAIPITFAVKFYLPPSISIQIQNGVTGDYAKILSKSTTGFTIELRNSSNNLITGASSRLIDWQAQGY